MAQYDGLIAESPYTKAYGVNVGTNVPRKMIPLLLTPPVKK